MFLFLCTMAAPLQAGVAAAAGLVTVAAVTADSPAEFVATLSNVGSWCVDHPWMVALARGPVVA